MCRAQRAATMLFTPHHCRCAMSIAAATVLLLVVEQLREINDGGWWVRTWKIGGKGIVKWKGGELGLF